jgi:hypothetical protein
VNLVEPPSCHNAIFFIGKDRRGNWVARQQNGLCGGLFVNRIAALRYALFENPPPGSHHSVQHPELYSGLAAASDPAAPSTTDAPQRRAA